MSTNYLMTNKLTIKCSQTMEKINWFSLLKFFESFNSVNLNVPIKLRSEGIPI